MNFLINHQNKLSMVLKMITYYAPDSSWSINDISSSLIIEKNNLNEINAMFEKYLTPKIPAIHIFLHSNPQVVFSFLMFPLKNLDSNKKLDVLSKTTEKQVKVLVGDTLGFMGQRLSRENQEIGIMPKKVTLELTPNNTRNILIRFKNVLTHSSKFYVNEDLDFIVLQVGPNDDNLFCINQNQINDYSAPLFSIEEGFIDDYSNNKLYTSVKKDFAAFEIKFREQGTDAWPLRNHF